MRASTLVRISFVAVVFLGVACTREPDRVALREFGVSDDSAPWVSMVSLLADPHAFDSRRVRVQAVLHLEFEGDRICLDRDSALDFVPHNCFRMTLANALDRQYKDIGDFNGQYVLVTGTIHSRDRGRNDLFPARIVATSVLAGLPTSRSAGQE